MDHLDFIRQSAFNSRLCRSMHIIPKNTLICNEILRRRIRSRSRRSIFHFIRDLHILIVQTRACIRAYLAFRETREKLIIETGATRASELTVRRGDREKGVALSSSLLFYIYSRFGLKFIYINYLYIVLSFFYLLTRKNSIYVLVILCRDRLSNSIFMFNIL